MKKTIKLTESDLIRLVKRIIRESEDWTYEDEKELSSLENEYRDVFKKQPTHGKSFEKDYGGDKEKYWEDLQKINWDEIESKRNRLASKRKSKEPFLKKQEDLRYSNVIKNRPSDYDLGKYRDEYNQLGDEMKSHLGKIPHAKDYEDFEAFIDDFNLSDDLKKYREKSERRSYLGKHMDKDY